MSNSVTRHSAATYDAIVVGAGLGGCSAAAHLAATGQRVLLLEQYSILGGSSHVFRRKGRWEFDCGVHYVGDCGPTGAVPTLLRGLGIDDRIEWLPLDTDGFDTIIGPDLELRTPVGWDAYLENLLTAFPDERPGNIRRYVSVLRSLGESIDRAHTPSTWSASARAMIKAGPTAAAFAAAPLITLFRACRLSPRTILALSTQCGALASTPNTLPSLMHAGFLHNYVAGGAYYPKGGGQMLTAGFAEVIRGHGGTIRTNTTVEKILTTANKVTGVRLDTGEVINAPVVVSGADVIKTFTDLVGLDQLPAAHRLRVKRLTMGRPLINGFFGIDYDLSHTPNSNFFVIPSWDDARSTKTLNKYVDDVLDGGSASDPVAWATQYARRQPMFIMSSTRRDPSNTHAAPVGHATVEVQTIAPYDPALWGVAGLDVESGEYRSSSKYAEVKKIILDGMLERMDTIYPGASSTVQLAELGSPATQERYVGNTGGGPFGIAVTPTQIGPLRPGSTTPITGLFLVGTSTRWGPGTEGAMVSGQHAASAVTGRNLSAEVASGTVLANRELIAAWGSDFDPLAACGALATTRPASAPQT